MLSLDTKSSLWKIIFRMDTLYYNNETSMENLKKNPERKKVNLSISVKMVNYMNILWLCFEENGKVMKETTYKGLKKDLVKET